MASAMDQIRLWIAQHRHAAATLLLLALALRALIPAGHMLAPGAMTLSVTLCSGLDMPPATLTIPIERAPQPDADSAKADCQAGNAGHAWLPAADAALLLTAMSYILLLSLRPLPALALARPRFRLPHRRGPPITA